MAGGGGNLEERDCEIPWRQGEGNEDFFFTDETGRFDSDDRRYQTHNSTLYREITRRWLSISRRRSQTASFVILATITRAPQITIFPAAARTHREPLRAYLRHNREERSHVITLFTCFAREGKRAKSAGFMALLRRLRLFSSSAEFTLSTANIRADSQSLVGLSLKLGSIPARLRVTFLYFDWLTILFYYLIIFISWDTNTCKSNSPFRKWNFLFLKSSW